jgi:nucleoid-associated protein YgaU
VCVVRDPSRADPIRATLAALACTWLTVALGRAAADLIVSAGQAIASPDRPVAAVVVSFGAAAAGALAAGCWFLAAANLRRPGRPAAWCDRVGARLTPALLRRAVGLTVGAGLGVAALGGVASASEPDLGWEVTTTATSDGATEATRDVAPLQEAASFVPASSGESPGAQRPTTVPTPPAEPVPEERTDGRLPASAPAPEAPGVVVASVTVRPGDSLWRIAAAHLDADASNAEIAASWPRWYEANRAVIGADPGLIHPGQVLQAPDGALAEVAP